MRPALIDRIRAPLRSVRRRTGTVGTDKAIDKLKAEECAIGPVVHERAISAREAGNMSKSTHGPFRRTAVYVIRMPGGCRRGGAVRPPSILIRRVAQGLW